VISLLVTDEGGRVVYGSDEKRSLSAAARRAIVKRDRHCRFPGCDRPAEWADEHHLVHWADGGPSRIDNVYLVCRPHHRLVHEGRWRLVLEPDGELRAVPP
jgi:hypothetical protein